MGKFKRSKSKPRKRLVIPEKWKDVNNIIEKTLKGFSQEGLIKKYKVLGSTRDEVVFTFNILFPFWERKVFFGVFLGERKNDCSISQTEHRFDLLIGLEAAEEQLRNELIQWIELMKIGHLLENHVVEKLNNYREDGKFHFYVKKAPLEEDVEKGHDIVISIISNPKNFQSFGVQIKKNIKEWVKHRNKYPHVPSILLDFSTPTESIVRAVRLIAHSAFERNYTEHINLKAPS